MKMADLINVDTVPKPLKRSLAACRKAYDGLYHVDDVARGAEDITNGATDAIDDTVGGVKNAVDDMTDNK